MRSSLADHRLAPVENLATNPSFERVTAGTTVVRRNLIPNPSPATSTSGFGPSGWGAGGTGTYDRIAGATPDGAGWGFAKTYATSPTNSGLGYIIDFGGTANDAATRAAVRPGCVYTISAWLFSPVDAHYAIQIATHNAAGTFLTVFGGANVAMKAGEWTRHSLTFRASSDTVSVRGSFTKVNGPTIPVGGRVIVTRTMVEERPNALPYIDGDAPNARGVAYAWEGAPYASPSVARAFVQEYRRNYAMNPDAKNSSSAYQVQTPTGYACRAVPETGTGNANDSAFALIADTGNGAVAAFRMRVGGVATPISPALSGAASVPLYVAFDYWASSIVAGKAHTLEFPTRGPGIPNGSVNFQNFAAFTPVAGWNRVEILTTLVPKGAMTGIDQFEHPQIVTPGVVVPDGTTLFRVGRVAVEMTASRPGDHFSGNETPDADMTPAFVGTVNSSASTLNMPLVDGVGGMNMLRGASFRFPSELRVIPTNASSDSCARVDLLPFVREGQTYTVMARLRVRTPHSAAYAPIQGTQRRSLFLDITGGGGNIRGYGGTQPSPNIAGDYVHRLTFTVPSVEGSPVTSLGARLYNGAPLGDAPMFWDDFALVRGVYTGPYLDGDMPRSVWRGAAHASASVGYLPA